MLRQTLTIGVIALLGTFLCLPRIAAGETKKKKPVNKLLYMYRFYYLPFSVEFDQGRTKDDILPFLPEKYPEPSRLLTAEELSQLDSEWGAMKDQWPKRSLLESTKVPLGETVRISQKIISHRIPLNRGAFDKISISDRIQMKEVFAKQPPAIRAKFKQLQFVKSFLTPLDEERFNFFVVGASWCNSSREYRVLFETLAKTFPKANLNLHSIVIDDPQEKVFESPILKELFPFAKKYSHDSIPKFIAFEKVKDKRVVWEEGEALRELYNRFFKIHRGYLDKKTSIFGSTKDTGSRKPALDPYVSSTGK